MEQQLLKLARQLESFDEASLMNLWERYAAIVSHFEPTKRWEEAALVLSLIQAKRWKNQLFNQEWASRVRQNNGRGEAGQGPDAPAPKVSFDLELGGMPSKKAEEKKDKGPKILAFEPVKKRRPR